MVISSKFIISRGMFFPKDNHRYEAYKEENEISEKEQSNDVIYIFTKIVYNNDIG